jgi:hypothetical protein
MKKRCISMHMLWRFSASSMISGDADVYSLLNMIMIQVRYFGLSMAHSFFSSVSCTSNSF